MQFFKLITLAIIISTSCKNNTEKSEEKKPIVEATTKVDEQQVALTTEQLQLTTITTTQIGNSAVSNTVKLNGVIDVPPQNLISINAQLPGYIRRMELLPGMYVKKGSVIATLSDQSYVQMQQDYLLAKSHLLFAQKEEKRQKELLLKEATSDKAYQQVLQQVATHRIEMNALAEKLKIIGIQPNKISEKNLISSVTIFSPTNCFVLQTKANVGKYVTQADVIVEMVNPDDIHLNLKVLEKDLVNIQLGQTVIAYNNAQPNKKYNCQIVLISKEVSPNGIIDVHCHFQSYSHDLVPGMYMNAETNINSALANTLPEDCIVNFEGDNFVFVDKGAGNYKLQSAIIGKKQNGFVEILNIQQFGSEPIVQKGAYTLLMKMKNSAEE